MRKEYRKYSWEELIVMNSLEYLYKCQGCHKLKPNTDYSPMRKSSGRKFKVRCKDCIAKSKRDKENSSDVYLKKRKYQLKKIYGITVEEYDIMHSNQNGKCLICSNPENIHGKDLCIDHNHETGKVRGLLCHKCNTAIGLLEDSIKNLESAIKYLNKYRL